MMPTISVLMPVYNAERFLAEAVESILTQTFSDFEFIILNDGSSDKSLTILQVYAERDQRIRLISRPNTGLVVALNEMLELAQGEFVARMDADDVSLPDRFEQQLAFLRLHTTTVCVGGAVVMIDEEGRKMTVLKSPESNDEIQAVLLRGHPALNHPSVMMRLAIVRKIGCYRAELYPAEDIDLFLRLGECGDLANLPTAVLKYREHSGSISHLRQAAQLERASQAASEACDRRGLPRPTDPTPAPRRPGRDRWSRHTWALRNGWWAYGSGELRTSAHYATMAIRLAPWNFGGWRLLICICFKRSVDTKANC